MDFIFNIGVINSFSFLKCYTSSPNSFPPENWTKISLEEKYSEDLSLCRSLKNTPDTRSTGKPRLLSSIWDSSIMRNGLFWRPPNGEAYFASFDYDMS